MTTRSLWAVLFTLATLPAQAHARAGLVHVGKGKFVPVAQAVDAGYFFYRDRWLPKKLQRKLSRWERQDAKVKSWADAYSSKSKSYRIKTNAPRYILELEIKPFLDELYKTYVSVFKKDFGLSGKAANKNWIYIYWGYETWRREEKADRGNPGYFVEGGELRVLYDPCDANDYFNTVFHEGAHQFFAASLPGASLPVWLDEALATYFEGCVYSRALGRIRKNHLSKGRLASAKEQILAFRKAGKVATPSAMFMHIKDADNFDAEHYALAWSFVYYLIHKDGGKHKKTFMKFLKAMNGSGIKPARRVFKEATRKSLSSYEKGWADWVLALEAKPQPEYQVLKVTDAAGLNIKNGDLLYSLNGAWVDSDAVWQRVWVDRDPGKPVELQLLRRSPQDGMDYLQSLVPVTVPAGSKVQLESLEVVSYERNVTEK